MVQNANRFRQTGSGVQAVSCTQQRLVRLTGIWYSVPGFESQDYINYFKEGEMALRVSSWVRRTGIVSAGLGLVVGQLLVGAVPALATASYTSGSIYVAPPTLGSTANYTLTVGGVTTSTVKCLQVQFTDTYGSTSLPIGMDTSGATLNTGATNYVPTPASWTVSNASSASGIVKITLSGGETPASASGRIVSLGNIVNSSSANQYYVTLSTFNNTDCASSPVDSGSYAFAIAASGVTVTATVKPTLTFSLGSTAGCSALTVSSSAITNCNHTVSVATNAASGYTLNYTNGSTVPTSGAYTISQIGATAAASNPGAEQFGLKASASGGGGSVGAQYSGSSYAFTTAGAVIATAGAASDTTTYTVTYGLNIANTTEPGIYTATVIYDVTPNF